MRRPRVLRLALVSLAVAGLFGLAACAVAAARVRVPARPRVRRSSSATAAQDLGLLQAGTLIVGMNLQFKPEMYLLNGTAGGL